MNFPLEGFGGCFIMIGVIFARKNVVYMMSLLIALGVLIYLIYLELLFVSIHLKSLYF
jgi:hypothetical protein